MEKRFNPLNSHKRYKIFEVSKYDKSNEVNSFVINGISTWIDRDTRASLVNSTNSRLKLGQTNTAIWLNGNRIELDCETLLNLLTQLEVYALNCYDVTEQHKANIQNLSTKEDVLNYNFKTGYPEKLNITL